VVAQTPVAWPQARAGYMADPAFHQEQSAVRDIDMSGQLHAVPSRIVGEFTNALRMYCAGEPQLANAYLQRAEGVYQRYATQAAFAAVPAHLPELVRYNSGRSKIFYAWVSYALRNEFPHDILEAGLREMSEYLLSQSADAMASDVHEDEDRLFVVLCLLAVGDYEKAREEFGLHVNSRSLKQLKKNFRELVDAIEGQLSAGDGAMSSEMTSYFHMNRLGLHKFRENNSFWLCVPISVIAVKARGKARAMPNWQDVIQMLLY
jgi:hypothetical protein